MDEVYGEHGIWTSLNLCVALFVLMLSLLGAVMCGMYRRLSVWLQLALLGFLGHVFVSIVQQVGPILLHQLYDSYTAHAILGLVLGVIRMISWALILVGFALALGDIQRKLSRTRPEVEEPRPRLPPPDTGEPFRERKEGSPDIQR